MIHTAVTLFNIFAAGTSSAASCARGGFFGLVPWYQYLKVESGTCNIVFDANNVLGGTSPVVLILVAIIDDLLRIAGFVAVGYMIYGGYKYITSQGSPDKTAEAQKTIINAVIGLVIAIISVGLVSFIGRSLVA